MHESALILSGRPPFCLILYDSVCEALEKGLCKDDAVALLPEGICLSSLVSLATAELTERNKLAKRLLEQLRLK